MKTKVLRRDEKDRPSSVEFNGDPGKNCPVCHSENVEPWGAIGFVPAGDRVDLDLSFSPIRHMRCCSCGAGWMRSGL